MGNTHSAQAAQAAHANDPDVEGQFSRARALLDEEPRAVHAALRAKEILCTLLRDHAHAPSAHALGSLYRDGTAGVERDLQRAVSYYEDAAALGSERSLFDIAKILSQDDQDNNVQKDVGKAVRYYRRAIDAGETRALFNLALLLHFSDGASGVENDVREAVALYRRAIDAGDTSALFNLAVLLHFGDEASGVEKDVREAVALYRRAIDAGETSALNNLAVVLRDGDEASGVEKDVREAVALYRRAIDAGDTGALFNLAVLLHLGDEASGVEKDVREAVALYRRAIDAGDTSALFNLALLLRHGDEASGVEKDVRAAVALYRRAIDAGHTEALKNLALILSQGDEASGVEKDVREAVALYRRAIDAGDTGALNNLAVLLCHGDKASGVEKDVCAAVALYRRRIDAGDTSALFNLAVLLHLGDEASGVEKDVREAVALYRRAIDAGETSALNNLAVVLRDGDEASGVEKDVREAVALYRRAIDAGDTGALFNLAVLLHLGDEASGVEKDVREAVSLYCRAIDAGHTVAVFFLAVLLSHVDDTSGVEKDVREVLALYRRAIDAGHTAALFNFANLLRHGDEASGVEKDVRAAVALYRRAIDAGDTRALNNLANVLCHGDEASGVEKDVREAVLLYRRAIDAGLTRALNNLANLQQGGVSDVEFVPDSRVALNVYNSAVVRDNNDGYATLVITHQHGATGLNIDANRAPGYFRLGWSRGNNLSGFLLARTLLESSRTSCSSAEAVDILEFIRAEQRDFSAAATHELAVLFEQGDGHDSVYADVNRAAQLHLDTKLNSALDAETQTTSGKLLLECGPLYPRLTEKVLQHGTTVPKRCLLITLGGGARGKTSIVRSIKRLGFDEEHKQTRMADFGQYIASPTEEQVEDEILRYMDLNDVSTERSVYTYAGLGRVEELQALRTEKPLDHSATVAEIKRNLKRPHRDVTEQIRRALSIPDHGKSFERGAVSIWDMAGQDEYEMAHSLFVQRASIIVFAVNLARVEDEFTKVAEVQTLAYWIRFAYNQTPEPDKVGVIIVATHRYMCRRNPEASLESLCNELRGLLGYDVRLKWLGALPRGKVPENIISIDNKHAEIDPESSGLIELEEIIQAAADRIVENRPATSIRWLALADKLKRKGERIYGREEMMKICKDFPGFPKTIKDTEQDVLTGFRALASMGRMVLFELSKLEWYVFMNVETIVKSVGAAVSAAQKSTGILNRDELSKLNRGFVEKDVLFNIWGKEEKPLRKEECEIMLMLLIDFDLVMDLDGGSPDKKLLGIPALYQSGFHGAHWNSQVDTLCLHVRTKFEESIPAGSLGRLFAYIHRKMGSTAPSPILVRKNVARITITGLGQIFVMFNRQRHELAWSFQGDRPVHLARRCLQTVENLLRSPGRFLRTPRIHEAIGSCKMCGKENTISLRLSDEWIFHFFSNLPLFNNHLPQAELYCAESACGREMKYGNVSWLRDFKSSTFTESDSEQPRAVARYQVFISHAGPDKIPLAKPLYDAIRGRGLTCFLDSECLGPDERTSHERMDKAAMEAKIGIFILSPEFAVRKWPMRELRIFLRRRGNDCAELPVLIPIFYRMSPKECGSFFEVQDAQHGADEARRALVDRSEFIREEKESAGSLSALADDLGSVPKFGGIDVYNDGVQDRRTDNRLPDAVIMQKIVESVVKFAKERSMI